MPDEMVTSALELAWLVARMASQARPPTPVPNALRPVVRFARLPATALATVRRVLDEDESFREQVKVMATDEHDIGRVSWLYLHRPSGWAEEIAESVRDATTRLVADDAARADRAAQRRAVGLEGALRRSQVTAADAEARAARAGRELVEERRNRKKAEEQLTALQRRVQSLEGERDSARRRAARADDLAETVAELERRVAGLNRAGADHAATDASLRAALADAERSAATTRDAATGAAAGAARALADATEAAGRLAEALARANRALDLSPADEDELAPPTDPAPSSPPRSPARRPPVRRPVALPPAVFDDSAEAAEFLVRVPGVTVLVDGYNASLAAWSGLPIAAQRARLIDASVELAARTGADVHLVFDGADQVVPLGPASGRRAVRWSFSPPGVEADDVLLQMVEGFDVGRPVVVASSDRRVRDGVRARGANAISTPQLFAVLRRDL